MIGHRLELGDNNLIYYRVVKLGACKPEKTYSVFIKVCTEYKLIIPSGNDQLFLRLYLSKMSLSVTIKRAMKGGD
jgi:hypothetical protein